MLASAARPPITPPTIAPTFVPPDLLDVEGAPVVAFVLRVMSESEQGNENKVCSRSHDRSVQNIRRCDASWKVTRPT